MNTKVIAVCVLVGLVAVAGWFGATSGLMQPQGDVIEVVRTAEGYSPKDITVTVGDTVTWKNESKEYHWPASDLHPTHGVYPEFDPRRPVGPGEDWSFTFTQTGEWLYHDHIKANIVGSVTVLPE